MNRERYRDIVRKFAGRRIVVLGDLMMDEYLWGKATRISPESPVMVVEVESESRVPGGAANVVNNLLALGASVAVVGIVGEDEAGMALREALRTAGADVSGVVADSSRPTTRKTRVVAHNQQVMRVDREQAHPISEEVGDRLLDRLQADARSAQALLVSDYNKGVVTPSIAEATVSIARGSSLTLTANPKPANARALSGAHVLQLNQAETEATALLCSVTSGELAVMGGELAGRLRAGTLVVTLGAKGLMLFSDGAEPVHVPPHSVEVYDPAGAGDTVISALTLAICAGATVQEAAEVANHAAACVVRKLGVATVTPRELLADLDIEDIERSVHAS